jgi:hypothetical protein
VEDVVDPAETRPLLCEWVESAYDVVVDAARVTRPVQPRP